jgi:hypothetical protein
VLAGLPLVLSVQLGVLFVEPVTRHVVWAGAFWIAALLVLVAGSPSGRAVLLAPMALGLALVGAGLVVQRAGWGFHPILQPQRRGSRPDDGLRSGRSTAPASA